MDLSGADGNQIRNGSRRRTLKIFHFEALRSQTKVFKHMKGSKIKGYSANFEYETKISLYWWF